MLRSRFGESENLGAFSPHPLGQGTALQLFSMVVGQIYEVSGRLFLGPGSYHTIPVICNLYHSRQPVPVGGWNFQVFQTTSLTNR